MRKLFNRVTEYWKFYLSAFASFLTILVSANMLAKLPTLSGGEWFIDALFTLIFFAISIGADVLYFRLNPIYDMSIGPDDREDRNWCYAGIFLPIGPLAAAIIILLSGSIVWAILFSVLFVALLLLWGKTGGKQTRKKINEHKQHNKKEYDELVRIGTFLTITVLVIVGILAFINGQGWFTGLIILAGITYWQGKKIALKIKQPGHESDKTAYPTGYEPKLRTHGIVRAILLIVFLWFAFFNGLPLLQGISEGVHSSVSPVISNYTGQPSTNPSTNSPGDTGAPTPTPTQPLPTATPTIIVTPGILPSWSGPDSFGATIDAIMGPLSDHYPSLVKDPSPARYIVPSGQSITCNAVTDQMTGQSIATISGDNSDITTAFAWCPDAVPGGEFVASTAAFVSTTLEHNNALQAQVVLSVGRWWLHLKKFTIRPGAAAYMAGAILNVIGETRTWVQALALELPSDNSQNTFILNGFAAGARGLESASQ